MVLSSEFNNENIRTMPINMTEWQEKQLAEQYFHLWMLSSIKFSIKWKNWLVSSSKKPCVLQVKRIISIKAFSTFKRLSSLAGETVFGIPAAAFIKLACLAVSSVRQIPQRNLQGPLWTAEKEAKRSASSRLILWCVFLCYDM